MLCDRRLQDVEGLAKEQIGQDEARPGDNRAAEGRLIPVDAEINGVDGAILRTHDLP
jgi:hypothetical protein